MVAIRDAVALVEEDNDFTRAGTDSRVQVVALQKRPRERQHDERQRREPHHQQQPVVNPPPAHRLVRNALHEHQRRKTDHLLLLALNQMDEYRNRQGRERNEE